ncbi:MAG: DUF2889 domain-containing protein [Pseudomonadota bacterium]
MTPRIQREEIHRREIDLRFYRRADGLYEVEGSLRDTKTHPFRRMLADEDMPPGEPLHDMTLRLVLDDSLRVRDVVAIMRATPFGICRGATETLEPLKGLQVGTGWQRRVREVLARSDSCMHFVELLGPMATTALQGMAPFRLARLNHPEGASEREAKVDSCFAYAAKREVVAQLWPELSRPAP